MGPVNWLRLAQTAETSMAEVRVGDRSRSPGAIPSQARRWWHHAPVLPDASNDFV